jgi:hypothetical protein
MSKRYWRIRGYKKFDLIMDEIRLAALGAGDCVWDESVAGQE